MKAKTMTMWKILTPLIALCFLVAAPPLAAQSSESGGDYKGQQQEGQQQEGQQKQQYQQKSSQPEPEDFKDEDLEKFAGAQDKVDEIRKEYSDELSQVEDQDKARDLQDKYSKKMVESIKDEDLSVEKYNKISRAAQSNPDLNKKIDEMAN